MTDQAIARLPGVRDPEQPHIILHVDMDCFYAACERLRRPELRGEPVVIGMGYDQEDPKGAVATASYEAREYGIESAMPISEALTRLPRRIDADPNEEDAPDPEATAYYIPVDLDYYDSISDEVRDILVATADVFEPVSIDEAYLDVTERTTWDEVEDFAQRLKTQISEEVGVTASVGVAPTKSAAKVASDHDKPDGLVVVQPGTVQDFFAPLDIESVHGIGPVTADKLREMGIQTAGNLATTDPMELEAEFGSRGREFYQRARGHDPRSVSPPDDPKSLSRETSFDDPITSLKEKQPILEDLARAVAERARKKGALYQTIGIKVVTPPFDVNTRAHSLPGPVDKPELVVSVTEDLLDEFAEARIRKLGVRVSNLEFSDREQAALSRWEGTDDPVRVTASDETAQTPRSDLATTGAEFQQLTLSAFIE